MKQRKETIPGDLIKIPFDNGIHTYARILIDGSYMIYDCPSTEERTDYDNITKSEYLFICRDNGYGVEKGFWPILASKPLDGNLKDFIPKYFNPNPADTANVTFYELNRNEVEDAIKRDWIKTSLHINGTHDMVHVQARISDYYNGTINRYNKANTDLFKRSLGLT